MDGEKMKIAGIPVLNIVPWVIWLVGKRMEAWDYFPAFFLAIIASGIIHYFSIQDDKEE
jgi:hypothetical protein